MDSSTGNAAVGGIINMTRTNYIPAENRKSKLKYINAMYTAKPLKLMPYFNR